MVYKAESKVVTPYNFSRDFFFRQKLYGVNTKGKSKKKKNVSKSVAVLIPSYSLMRIILLEQ
jgi:hypothetical protein